MAYHNDNRDNDEDVDQRLSLDDIPLQPLDSDHIDLPSNAPLEVTHFRVSVYTYKLVGADVCCGIFVETDPSLTNSMGYQFLVRRGTPADTQMVFNHGYRHHPFRPLKTGKSMRLVGWVPQHEFQEEMLAECNRVPPPTPIPGQPLDLLDATRQWAITAVNAMLSSNVMRQPRPSDNQATVFRSPW
ncbi:uncharacterized protein B0H64DRAFT_394961 [Chaetomium fimeti]|uniref:Uncharacterized protein n=1 Tax=Chaetomium fimeti TaxID=1854472 RepID=A0AAE0LRZ4_9PEZI|nr:hypothetical protein B0H64DRAFT_394961 [Chaetomium fimeti]